jgi:hypothetical protein
MENSIQSTYATKSKPITGVTLGPISRIPAILRKLYSLTMFTKQSIKSLGLNAVHLMTDYGEEAEY